MCTAGVCDSVSGVQVLRERSRCLRFLQDSIRSHVQVPMGLGSKSSSVERKLGALLYASWLERGSRAMDTMPSMVCSMTTDLGVESGLLDHRCNSWKCLAPPWMDCAKGLDEDCGECSFDSSGLCPLFSRGITIPGILHIVNNMTAAMDEKLSMWDPWLDGLRSILDVLSVRHHRERFLGTCVKPFHPELEAHFLKKKTSRQLWGGAGMPSRCP